MQTGNEPKILIVDDDEVCLPLVSRMLKNYGFQSIALNDSTMVLKTVDEEKPDLVLLDLVMPKVCGTEVLEALRKKYSRAELPIVMLTGMNDSQNIADCLKLGANDFIAKPLDSVVAVARISNQLEMARLYRENLAKKEIETLNAMIVTYNHEINNPLSAAMLGLPSEVKNVSQENLDDVRAALQRIAGIVRKIDLIAHKTIRKDQYSDGSKIIQL